MADGEDLDGYSGRIGVMTAWYASLWSTLDDEALVKKLLDTVPDRPYPVVAGIEHFCNIAEMTSEEALGSLKVFDERARRRGKDDGRRNGEKLMPTAAKWAARSDSRAEADSTTTTLAAWCQVAAGRAAGAATTVGSGATSSESAPSRGRRRHSWWRSATTSSRHSSEPRLRR